MGSEKISYVQIAALLKSNIKKKVSNRIIEKDIIFYKIIGVFNAYWYTLRNYLSKLKTSISTCQFDQN